MDYYDLGDFSRRVTTASKQTQLWFDRGLIWTYAYNHEEAITCFEQAAKADETCAMAYWGIAYAIGPNYNKPWETFEEDEKQDALLVAKTAAARCHALRDQASEVERALIDAIQVRYPEVADIETFAPWNDAYAASMREVYRSYPDDLDICTLFAEALMNRTPWKLWDLPSGLPAKGADTIEAVEVLETALTKLGGAWDHPGLLHMYIHLMEMSPRPESALRQGDRLHHLVPDAGHLLHMATHIDVLCGDYQNVVDRNETAIQADQKFLARAGAENFYSVYRCHNYHFKIYGAMFLGQPEPAIEAAEALSASLPKALLAPMADWFEAFVPMKQHVLIRFGRWQEILAQELPQDADLYCVTTALMRYARTVALANSNDISGAEAESGLFFEALDNVPVSRMLFNNTCRDILQVAEQMMLGELEYHKGNHDAAFDHLRQAVRIDDALPYDEPWGWMQPARHALGALLLDCDNYAEAEAVYRADLGLDTTLSRACQHPNNVWSLHGLYECLMRREAGAELLFVKLQLDKALARASVPIRASCYCRKSAAA